jgi:hypothetical protein
MTKATQVHIGTNNETGSKNIHDIAKEFNLYTYENMSEEYKYIYENELNSYRKEVNIPIPSFFINNNSFEIGVFFECKIFEGMEKEHKYIDHQYTLIKYKNSDILFRLHEVARKKDKYELSLYFDYYNKYHSISYDNKTKAIKTIQEPNYIGVFTEQKILNWIEYNLKYIEVMENLLNELNAKNIENEREVLEYIDSLEGKGKVSRRTIQNEIQYSISTDLFDINFTLHLGSSYLSQNFRFKGNTNDIVNITKKY